MDALERRITNPCPSLKGISREISLRWNRHATENRLVEVGKCAPVARDQIGMDVSCVVDHDRCSRISGDTVKPPRSALHSVEVSMGVYFITGCGRGIGLAVTQLLLARGDRVIGSIRNGPPPTKHESLRIVTFDLRDQAAIDAAAAAIDEPVDALVNNAGIAGPKGGPAYDVDLDDFADVLDVNLLGPLRVTRAFMPLLRRSKNAKVMTLSSQLGGMRFPVTDHIAYCTSKAALNKLMQSLTADLRAEGIPLVIAHPGWVRTDMGGPSASIDPDESAAGLINLIDGLTIDTTGRFMNWNGTEREG